MKIQQLIQSGVLDNNSEKSIICDKVTESLRVGAYNVVEINLKSHGGRISGLTVRK